LGGLAAQGFLLGKTKFPQTGAWQTALLRTGFLQNLNRSELRTLMVYFQGLRLNYGQTGSGGKQNRAD